MIEIIDGKIYISNKRMSLHELSHPDGAHEPVTALIVIGGDDFKCHDSMAPFDMHANEVDCGNPFDSSEWDKKIEKDSKKVFYSVQDNTMDNEGKKRYRDEASGNYALVMQHYYTLTRFLKDGESAYHFWLYSQHGKLCIVTENPIDAIAIVQAYAIQARKLQGLNDIDFRKMRTEYPKIDLQINTLTNFDDEAEAQLNFSTKKVVSVVDAAYERRYARASLQGAAEPGMLMGQLNKLLEKYLARRTDSASAAYKLRLVSQQIYFLQKIQRERLPHDHTSTTFISIAINAEHNLLRPESWEERGVYTASSGGKFIKIQRHVFQMLLDYLQIDRQKISDKPIADFEDMHEALLKGERKPAATSSPIPTGFVKISLFNTEDASTVAGMLAATTINNTTIDKPTRDEANLIAEKLKRSHQ